MRKYICDNCGKEVSQLWAMTFKMVNPPQFGDYIVGYDPIVGEYCEDCKQKIEKPLFQQGGRSLKDEESEFGKGLIVNLVKFSEHLHFGDSNLRQAYAVERWIQGGMKDKLIGISNGDWGQW